ncbi:MAG: protein kinase, partial [Nannocystaceae bacterium]
MRCPPSLALLHFARGTASEPQQQAIAAHVAGCPACTARLRQAAHGSAATGPVPSPPTRPVVPPPPMPPGPAAPLPDYGDDVATRVQAITPRPGMVDEDARTAPPPSRRAPIVEPSGALTLGVTPPSIHDPPTPISAAFETSPATGRAELPRGTPLGRYLVVEPLGSGGLGDVYTAYDPELDRCVAIKVLRPSADETDSWDAPSGSGAGVGSDRLIREAKALARLSHPNVVAIYDVGRLGGDVFIAMERVEGLTLSQWSRAAERSWTQVRDVFLGAGEGLAAAHDAGIVHRDFKPANVIVDPDGRARVLDFGLARAVHREDGSGLIAMPRVAELRASRSGESLDGPVTMEGTVMGTPQYMAPEQFEGSEHTGPAADQFGFCVAMWEALYRERPFQGEGIAELIQAIRAGRITEPSEDRDVPPWLQLLLRRGLSVDPQARFGSMQEL